MIRNSGQHPVNYDLPINMVHFRSLFRRSKKQTAENESSSGLVSKTSTSHHEHASTPAIAGLPAAGMQRSNQATYITTYTCPAPVQAASTRPTSDVSFISDSSKTAVDDGPVPTTGQSVWKGAANGTTYDKREELTPEDEDMWANLAM